MRKTLCLNCRKVYEEPREFPPGHCPHCGWNPEDGRPGGQITVGPMEIDYDARLAGILPGIKVREGKTLKIPLKLATKAVRKVYPGKRRIEHVDYDERQPGYGAYGKTIPLRLWYDMHAKGKYGLLHGGQHVATYNLATGEFWFVKVR